eukprot:TRINITY_DN34025_c0_g1_i1.p1 TRINITY_DN34025_c0_g1~~TRINITY_DN34025_c0_g1_i1.p1  ORF type:complete len:359 (+),score=59.20 TRINITY_DN34025_c0_g1_i1:76-1152(+)
MESRTQVVLPLTVSDPFKEEVIQVDIYGGVEAFIDQIRKQLGYEPKTTFSMYWAGDEVTDEVLRGLSAGDEITVGALSHVKEVKKAILQGNLQTITKLYKSGISFTDRIPGTNKLPIEMALYNPEVLQHLCLLGVDITHKIGTKQRTLLHMACSNNDHTDIRILLRFKADPNARDFNGSTPLHVIAKSYEGGAALLDTFFSCCTTTIRIDQYDNAGQTPLQVACKSGSLACIRQFAQLGSNLKLVHPHRYSYSIRLLLKDLLIEFGDAKSEIRFQKELPKSREEYFGNCDPCDIKELHRSHAGKRLPRVKATKKNYQKHVAAEAKFVSLEKDFHDSRKLPGTSYADMIRGVRLLNGSE